MSYPIGIIMGMCIMCDGASRDEVMFDLHAKVSRHGWAIQCVESDGRGDLGWLYTVGLSRGFGHPELVIVERDLLNDAGILDELGEMVRAGSRFHAGDTVAMSDGFVGLGAVHPVHLADGLLALCDEYDKALGSGGSVREALQVVPPVAMTCCESHRSVPLLSDPTTDLESAATIRPNRGERRARARKRPR